jgi:hypothetical protein
MWFVRDISTQKGDTQQNVRMQPASLTEGQNNNGPSAVTADALRMDKKVLASPQRFLPSSGTNSAYLTYCALSVAMTHSESH